MNGTSNIRTLGNYGLTLAMVALIAGTGVGLVCQAGQNIVNMVEESNKVEVVTVTETVTEQVVIEVPVETIVHTETIKEIPVPQIETRTITLPGETVYVDVPGPVQYIETAVDPLWEENVYNAAFERGASIAHEGFRNALTTPCATEDGSNCYWNAQIQGNGEGASFVDVAGVVYYLTTSK